MERREQIKSAAEKATCGVGGNWEEIRKGAELWFIRGAIWADKNPKEVDPTNNWYPVSVPPKEDGMYIGIGAQFPMIVDYKNGEWGVQGLDWEPLGDSIRYWNHIPKEE